jgi:hypothetical protein
VGLKTLFAIYIYVPYGTALAFASRSEAMIIAVGLKTLFAIYIYAPYGTAPAFASRSEAMNPSRGL